MKNIFKDVIGSPKRVIKTLLPFEIIYKFIAFICFIPIISVLINQGLKLSGFTYISYKNLKNCLQSPIIIAIIILIIIISAYIILFEISAVTIYFGKDFNNVECRLSQLLFITLKESIRIFKPKNIALVLYIFLIFPIISMATSVNILITNITIPRYITNFIKNSILIKFLIMLLLVALTILSIYMIFIFCYFFLERKSLVDSLKSSIKIIKGNFLKTFFYITLNNVLWLMVYIVFYFIVMYIVSIFSKIMNEQHLTFAIFLSIFRVLNYILILVISSFEVITNIAITVILYLKYTNNKKKIYYIPFKPYKSFINASAHLKKIVFVVIASLVCVNSVAIYFTISDSQKIVDFTRIKITSHRGSSLVAPENTLVALEYAVRDLADYVEIDVQETKDGEIILFHDSNTNRILKQKGKIADFTYKELLEYDVGAWFSEEFAGTKIPTFREAIQICKAHNMKMNIELKPQNKNEEELAKKVVKIIQEENYVGNCVITSFNYTALKFIKLSDENIKTGFIISAAYGDFYTLKYADFFSVDANFVTEKLITKSHKMGKEVHVWTVNNAKEMERVIKLGVDNIITDDPIMAREIIYSKDIPAYTLNIMNLILNKKDY